MTAINIPSYHILSNCSLCDRKLFKDKLNFATTLTPTTKTGLPEKISQLLGEEYLIIVTANDYVCRTCYNLLSQIDKSEYELSIACESLFSGMKSKFSDIEHVEPPQLPSFSSFMASPVGTENKETLRPDRGNNDSILDDTPDVEILQRTTSNPEPVAPSTSPTAVTVSKMAKRSKRNANGEIGSKQPKSVNSKIRKTNRTFRNTNKVKIFKCGFCGFPSKDLSKVRWHMKAHLNQSRKMDKNCAISSSEIANPTTQSLPTRTLPTKDCAVSLPALTAEETTNSTVIPTLFTSPKSCREYLKLKMFRCQVCSASYDDRKKCLEHLSEHAPSDMLSLKNGNEKSSPTRDSTQNDYKGVLHTLNKQTPTNKLKDSFTLQTKTHHNLLISSARRIRDRINLMDLSNSLADNSSLKTPVQHSLDSSTLQTQIQPDLLDSCAPVKVNKLFDSSSQENQAQHSTTSAEQNEAQHLFDSTAVNNFADVAIFSNLYFDSQNGISTEDSSCDIDQLLNDAVKETEMPTANAHILVTPFSCSFCIATFDNDVDFAKHLSEHVQNTVAFNNQDDAVNTPSCPVEMSGGSLKYSSIGLEIEEMLAALSSEPNGRNSS